MAGLFGASAGRERAISRVRGHAPINSLLNNEIGLFEDGSGAVVLTNIADGNNLDGISAGRDQGGPPATFTHNTANFNGGLGINASSPAISGPNGNRATGNGISQQCFGVVCSPS